MPTWRLLKDRVHEARVLMLLQGEWHCGDCTAERPAVSQHAPRNPRLQFMAAQLSLARIDRMWRAQDGAVRFSGRWYCRPEDTVDGRQVPCPQKLASLPGFATPFCSSASSLGHSTLRHWLMTAA